MSKRQRVALYCRVSTGHQSTDAQREELAALAEKREWEVQGVYEDVISGATDKRPELDKMLEAVRKGKVDAVAVWKLDRLGRSLSHLIAIINELHACNVAFVSYTDNFDTTLPQGRLLFHIMGAIGEYERSLIRMRVVSGLEQAKRKGTRLGRPRASFDYRQALERRKEGWSLRRIAKAEGVSLSTVSRTLGGVS